MRRPSVRTSAAVSVGTASAVVVTDNPSRLALLLMNSTATDVQIKLRVAAGLVTNDTPVATLTDFTVKAGAPAIRLDGYTGPVAAIASVATTLGVIEV